MKFKYDNFHPPELNDEPVVLCSHYDLDGVGSTYFAKMMFNVVKHYCSGYPKVINNVQKGIGLAKVIVFVDLDVPEDAVKLALKNFDRVYYCDHHPGSIRYTKLHEAIPDRFKYLFEPTLAATKILAMKSAQLGIKLSKAEVKFANVCDAYDVWRQDSKLFDFGYHLNTLFWKKNFWGFQSCLSGLEDLEDYKKAFSREDWEFALAQRKHVIEYVSDEDNYEIIEAENFTAAFYLFPKGEFHVNDVLLTMSDKFSVVIGNEVGKETASVRINIEGMDLNKTLLAVKEKNPNLLAGSGHKFAAGMTLKSIKTDDVMDIVYDIVDELDAELSEKKNV